MTTGRINQVTTFQNIAAVAAMSTKVLGRPGKATFLSVGVCSLGRIKFQTLLVSKRERTLLSDPQGRNRLVPRSHIIQTHWLLCLSQQKKSWPSERTTLRPGDSECIAHQATVDSQVY
jgi:hypothetical protein